MRIWSPRQRERSLIKTRLSWRKDHSCLCRSSSRRSIHGRHPWHLLPRLSMSFSVVHPLQMRSLLQTYLSPLQHLPIGHLDLSSTSSTLKLRSDTPISLDYTLSSLYPFNAFGFLISSYFLYMASLPVPPPRWTLRLSNRSRSTPVQIPTLPVEDFTSYVREACPLSSTTRRETPSYTLGER